MRFFRKILNPSIYHGHDKSPPFFEGWYYKLISSDQNHRYAVIPGIFLGNNGYAFVQLLNGSTGQSEFFKYPIDQFWANQSKFDIRIADNRFQLEKIDLNINTPENRIQGSLEFSDVTGWPVTLTSPGIMGWYAWVPKMECYHAVLGFDHEISGNLAINNQIIDFNNGRGYIEKDWGQSFPGGYVWMQSNHFSQSGICLTGSVAMIPWIRKEFRGFIFGLWVKGKLYQFATYTGAKLSDLNILDHQVFLKITDGKYTLEVVAERKDTGLLKGPTRVAMDMRVAESLKSIIHVQLKESNNSIIFEDSGYHAGLEVAGDLPRLLAG